MSSSKNAWMDEFEEWARENFEGYWVVLAEDTSDRNLAPIYLMETWTCDRAECEARAIKMQPNFPDKRLIVVEAPDNDDEDDFSV